MNDQQFGQLCRDTCRHLDVAYADGDPGISEITVKGINISLIFDEEEAADRLFCYVDVGPIATANQAAAHHNLLQLNLLTGSKTIGVYGVHPASGNAIFSVHLFNPDAVTGEALARLLSVYADRAVRMRSTLLQNSVNASVEDILMQFHEADEAQSMTDLA